MRKTVAISSAVLLVLSIVGFVVSLIVNAFVLDDYDAYGEVPIPSTRTLHLPQGDVTVSFHTQVIGRTSGGGMPLPPGLGIRFVPPTGVADPVFTQNVGGTTTVNNDAHVRVGTVQIPEAGDYTIETQGSASAFVSPRMSFGHGNSYGFVPWVFGGLFGVSLLALLASTLIPMRRRRVVRSLPMTPGAPMELSAPSDEGIRIQQLKTLSSLRDSGAITDEEYETEKRRLLDGL